MVDALDAELREKLVEGVGAALRNNAQLEATDHAGRAWFVTPDVLNNQSVVLIRVSRGTDTQVRNLSTATLVPGVAAAAIEELDGALT